jgi:hypothetical protein
MGISAEEMEGVAEAVSTDNSEMMESLQTLNKALEAGKYNSSPESLTQGAALQVLDLSERIQPLLTESAKLDLTRKSPRLLRVTEDSQVFQAIYFSCVVKTGNEQRGLEEIAKIVNDMSHRGIIHSVLAPPSALELARMSSVAKSVVFFFPLVPLNAVKDCEALYKGIYTLEGGVGQEIEDTSVPLAEGEFLADIRVSHFMSMIQDQPIDPEKILQNRIDEFLAVLPKGTEVRSVTKLAVMDLSLPYEVKFYNALLQRVKKVDLDYVREIAKFDGGIHQFNLFTGIRYYDKDQKQLYSHNY